MRARRLLLVLFASACAVSAMSQTQSQTSTSSNPTGNNGAVPVIKANTRAVVVDIVVTQGKDEPVTSLHKQDFQLLEDGRPQAIDFFEEHTAVAGPQNIPLVPMPPHVYTNVPSAPLSDSVNVLLLDSLNTPRADQSYVHQQILTFLKTMKPATRVAIFTLGSKLRMIQGFTDDPAVLQAALNDKSFGFNPKTTNVSRSRKDDDDDKAEVAAKIEAFGGGGRGAGTAGVIALRQSQADFVQFETDQRVAITLEALQDLGRYLAGIPGRKNLIWFASSYPIYFFPKSSEKQPFNDQREYTSAIKRTSDLLTLSKVAVYPIDAEGMMDDHQMDSENGQSGVGAGLLGNVMTGAGQRADTMLAMEQLAADTGGEAIFNTNDLNGALNHAINNGAHYYTLVYAPANKNMDGQFRRIEIKLDRAKCKLSYRRGYYADDIAKEDAPAAAKQKLKPDPIPVRNAVSSVLLPLLGRGLPSATQVLYGIRVQPAASQPPAGSRQAGFNPKLAGPTTRFTADFMIRYKDVKLEAAPNGMQTGRVEVGMVGYDRDGKPLNWVGETVSMNLDAKELAAIQKTGIPTHLEIDLPRTSVFLATGVYDLQAGKAGTLEIQLENAADSATASQQKTQASISRPATK